MDPHRVLRVIRVLLLLLVACYAAPPQSLRFTQILFRHGDRTAIEVFPNNPYGPEDWPNGYGQLTQLGMRQARDLGRYFRTRYDGFLNSTYVADQIYVRSTDKDRTLMSASSVLAGLYPPQGFQQWDAQLDWQPVPVHTQPTDNDIEMTVDVDCRYYNGLYVDALLSDDAMKLYRDNKDMIAYVSEKAGWGNVTLLPNIWDTFDPLFCMMQHPELGFVIPEWVSADVYAWLETLNEYYYYFNNLTPEMRNILTGPFFRMMTGKLREAAGGEMSPPSRKIMLYSSHDSMEAAIFIALGLWDGLKPPYSSAIFFELHERQAGDFTVQMFYKNDTVTNPSGEPMTLTIPGCSTDCPLDQFLDLLEPKIYKGTVQQWREQCDMESNMNGAAIAVSVLAVCFIIPVTAVIGFIVCRKRARAQEYTSV